MKKLRIVIIVFLILVMLVSGAYIGKYIFDSMQSSSEVKELRSLKNSAQSTASSPLPSSLETPSSEDTRQILPEYQELYARNPDLKGWLKIEGTNIDYPVMQTDVDGQYYLYRNFDKQDDTAGMLFFDERCSLEPRSTNLLIHGHNMKNGSMFHNLRYYKEKKYFQQHPLIEFDTLYEHQTYQIVAVLQTEILPEGVEGFRYYAFINAANETEFNDFRDNIKKASSYDTGYTIEYGDELISLSTCDYPGENQRLVVIAKRIDNKTPAMAK